MKKMEEVKTLTIIPMHLPNKAIMEKLEVAGR